ncbi:hypothetical protein COU12_00075 [Candidatus Jorgensenbacteria bacterium CG10_big_fil_rev_8_21_14_0_10_54_38]|uniref:Uncharacterized protein n=1 Tax=Candidatus Jorgensenbacteria bacterium CG10_big_fil_rev_8_21_14_0_10_54_38 TaxID=1974593 RepID=A0A2M6WGS3_9BACT|nr:MAG: hypothetical protein COU12_00075 [Candidatus Jorgensenbacteria bacterium CG10_big_fil_rev_8_21_14_0_10_54_38]
MSSIFRIWEKLRTQENLEFPGLTTYDVVNLIADAKRRAASQTSAEVIETGAWVIKAELDNAARAFPSCRSYNPVVKPRLVHLWRAIAYWSRFYYRV